MEHQSFNPRTHAGCDPRKLNKFLHGFGFQSTHPRGVRREQVVNVLAVVLFQSTHPRGVRQSVVGGQSVGRRVSIHAPTRGATQREAVGEIAGKFQSTHPRGVRHAVGADAVPSYSWFQSTHPRGVRQHGDDYRVGKTKFQSTHPRGVRPSRVFLFLVSRASFNPRTHAGCDWLMVYASEHEMMFQSTHPRGVRRIEAGIKVSHLKFQSTHPRGVRRSLWEWRLPK